MFATHFFQQINQWLPALSRPTQSMDIPTTAEQAAVEQVIVQPGDTYFLAAGTYRLHVLTGQLWLPEQDIFGAGAQCELRVDWRGLELRPATARPVVFTLRAQM